MALRVRSTKSPAPQPPDETIIADSSRSTLEGFRVRRRSYHRSATLVSDDAAPEIDDTAIRRSIEDRDKWIDRPDRWEMRLSSPRP